ncbi:unnamed protein product [Alopecurus aequalis]
MSFAARMKDLGRKYGGVALGVHVSVSAATAAGLYVAIDNNVDVDAIFRKIGISPGVSTPAAGDDSPSAAAPGQEAPLRNWTGELVASSGGTLALAILCNKALIPVRIPITIALTPPIARLLARWKLVKSIKT